MHIGMVTTQFAKIGGVENVVRSLARELDEKGHTVSLITRERTQNTGEFEPFFEDVHVIEDSEGYFKYLKNGRKFLKENQDKFDIFHFHNWSPILPAAGLEVPKVLTLHGTSLNVARGNSQYFRMPMYWFLEECAVNIPDILTSITNYHLRPFKTSAETRVIRNGVDTDRFKPSQDQEKLRDKWNVEGEGILIVGQHVENKGHNYLFKAVENLDKEHTVMVPSNGPLTEELKELAEKEGINAEFYGRVSDQEMVELYQAADVFCLPSWSEGLPLSMLEAISCGLPVVVSDIADNKEIVEEGGAGYAVQPKDSEDLHKALKRIINEDFSREEIRSYAEENLDWEKIAGEYKEVFREVNEDI